MKRLWLFCFPLLFLPNFGSSRQTAFGILEISDWLIVPFIVLLLIAPAAKYKQQISQLKPFLWAFVVWALLSTLTLHFRCDYLDDLPVIIGSCLKLCRLSLYVAAAVLIARALNDPLVRGQWMWALAGALAMLSIGLILSTHSDQPLDPSNAIEGYKSYNLTIVSVAILSSYIVGLWVDGAGSRLWRHAGILIVAFAGCSVMLSSSLSSHGRGGWLAFLVGFVYILWKRMQTVKALAILVLLGCLSISAYDALPSFKSLVDATLSPTNSNSENALDDGARVSTWQQEAPKVVNQPLFGTGFYHRGGESGLWQSGSHNFFLQMFLETGVVGGGLVLAIFLFSWRQADCFSAVRNKLGLATRAALISAVTGGMSGEYYYGGTGVLVLFAVLAMAGSLPTENLAYRSERGRWQPLRWRTVAS